MTDRVWRKLLLLCLLGASPAWAAPVPETRPSESAVEGSRLVLVPTVHVSTRGQTVIYEPEPPFTLELTLTGDEMKGVAVKDGTTFVFRRLR